VTAAAFNESSDVAGVSKGYPLYYLEVLNDTNASDSIDTEGLIIDIVSNSTSGVVVAADTSTLGIQGDENVVIRRHLTLSDIFTGSTGLGTFEPVVTIYNEDGPGSAVDHLPDGSGGFVLASDFTTVTSDVPVYPGTGFVITNSTPVTIIPRGVVKETDTQVVVYGGSVNIVSALKPVGSVNMSSDGRLNDALDDFNDVATTYTTDGTLTGDIDFVDDGAGGFLETDFVTPTVVAVDGTSQPIVIVPIGGTVYKASGNLIP
jgi:hypothetical protein